MMTFETVVNDKNIYRRYAEVVDISLKLSEREKDVFAIMLRVQHKWDGDKIDLLGKRSRKEITSNTYVSSANLSKYIKTLIEKKAIVEGEYGYVINPYLFPNFDDSKFSVLYNFKKENKNE